MGPCAAVAQTLYDQVQQMQGRVDKKAVMTYLAAVKQNSSLPDSMIAKVYL